MRKRIYKLLALGLTLLLALQAPVAALALTAVSDRAGLYLAAFSGETAILILNSIVFGADEEEVVFGSGLTITTDGSAEFTLSREADPVNPYP